MKDFIFGIILSSVGGWLVLYVPNIYGFLIFAGVAAIIVVANK